MNTVTANVFLSTREHVCV